MAFLQRSSNVLMTEGCIWKKMLVFSVPIMFGNLFQQLYTICDSLIVGNLLGPGALAAVGATGSIINMLIGLINGIGTGAGVIVARFYGAGDDESVSHSVHTITAFGLIASVILFAVSMLFTDQILVLAGIPADIFDLASIYIRTHYIGSLFFVMYNIFTGILQAVGDSRHPLVYLVISSVINVILDYVFIAYCSMGVMGAALATVIAQGFSTVLCLNLLIRTKCSYRLVIRKIAIRKRYLADIVRYGIPTGIQSSIVALANVIVQYFVNIFGTAIIAGSTVFDRINNFANIPFSCFAAAVMTFTGQNLGAGKYDRMKKGANFAILGSLSVTALMAVAIIAFAPGMIGLFTDDPDVIAFGASKAYVITPFMPMIAVAQTIAAILRGAGRSFTAMAVLVGYFCGFKLIYLAVTTPIFMNIYVLYAIYPITWTLAALTLFIIYRRTDWTKSFR